VILTQQDLTLITGKRQRSAQRRVLSALSIPYRLRPDGSIVVFHYDIHATPQTQPTPPELRFSTPRRVLFGKARKVGTPRR
jgi:hypothetical protein